MSRSKKISVMISSRCNDEIEFEDETQKLSNVRKKLKEKLESIKLFDKELFEVWINEDAPPEEGSQDSWDHCMNQISKANIVIILYNGNSGWSKEYGDIGICHAELQTALNHAPAKVRLIEIKSDQKVEENDRNARFKQYIEQQNLFRGGITAKNGEEIIEICKEALRDAVVDMVHLGVAEARKGKFYTGAALDWSKLDFQKRKEAMEETLVSNLKSRKDATYKEKVGVFVPFNEKNSILIKCHAIPDSMTIPAAKEMIGQPFLSDYKDHKFLEDKYVGIVHLIASYGKVTEAQTRKLIGCSDIMIVSPPFGIYAVEHIHKIQLILISNCRDDTSTRNGVQRFFAWLEQSGESDDMLKRAIARTKIIKTIAEVN
ncbi:MAG: DUF4062 domain-containing protein [Xenococcaceae cyanobacterium MO_167.B52]|nr:DUF4062 domain-containing protein [Xenococcaceae cyanobacterium MO_167.B52]